MVIANIVRVRRMQKVSFTKCHTSEHLHSIWAVRGSAKGKSKRTSLRVLTRVRAN